MRQGGGREGELSKKNNKNVNFGQKLANFFKVAKKSFKKFLGNVKKLQFFGVREGVK